MDDLERRIFVKHGKAGSLLVLIMALLLAGCGGIHFSLTLTETMNSCTIEADNAKDGDTIESNAFSAGPGASAVMESSLEKGQLQIDVAEASVIANEEGPSDVIPGMVVETVTLGAGDTASVSLEGGDYVFQITVIGETSGKAVIRIE